MWDTRSNRMHLGLHVMWDTHNKACLTLNVIQDTCSKARFSLHVIRDMHNKTWLTSNCKWRCTNLIRDTRSHDVSSLWRPWIQNKIEMQFWFGGVRSLSRRHLHPSTHDTSHQTPSPDVTACSSFPNHSVIARSTLPSPCHSITTRSSLPSLDVIVVLKIWTVVNGPAQFGSVWAQPGTIGNGPGPAWITSRAVLGPGRQPVRWSRHDPFSSARSSPVVRTFSPAWHDTDCKFKWCKLIFISIFIGKLYRLVQI
jgi:hypothetical protein